MRMWKVPPKCMCNQHLLGEHLEMHMFIGSIRSGRNINNYQVEQEKILRRHHDLANEMLRRGMHHKSPITEADEELMTHYLATQHWSKQDISESSGPDKLAIRCKKCAILIKEEFDEI